jgi:hypothetical protein
MTHTLIFEEKLQNYCKEKIRHVPKSCIVQEKMNIKSFDKMTSNVNNTHFGLRRDVTKIYKEE